MPCLAPQDIHCAIQIGKTVDQANAFDPESQQFPDNPLAETLQADQNDGCLSAFVSVSRLARIIVLAG